MAKKRLPWEMPDMAHINAKDIEAESKKEQAFGDTIEGGCWFSHVGGIDEMEKDYANRSKEHNPDSDVNTPQP